MNLNYGSDLFLIVDCFFLLVLSLGILGLRFFFSDFMSTDKPYANSHIVWLMIFTLFTAEVLLVLYTYNFFSDSFQLVPIDPLYSKYMIVFPRIIFFATLCYFIYWIFKMFQSRHAYFIEFKRFYEQFDGTEKNDDVESKQDD